MTPAERQRIIVRTSIIGIAANVVLVIFKAIVGLAANSIAIVLDAVNNLTDALSSIITILGAKLGNKKPDRDHPMGHGRYEYLSAMVIVALVLYAGVTAFVESVNKIITPAEVDYSATTLIVVAAAVVVKIILGRYVGAKGKQVDSGSLIASGKDALFDALVSASVLLAAAVYLLTGINLEAYVGIFISLVIVKAGIDMMRDTLNDILGTRPSSELSTGIKQTIAQDEQVLGVYDLLLESYGPDLTIAAVHVEVADTLTAADIDAMTRRVQAAVFDEHHIVLGTVGIYSRNTQSEAARSMYEVARRIAMSHEGVIQMHGFYLDEESKTVSFDLVISFDVTDRDALHEHICDEIAQEYPDYTMNIVLDRDLSD